jgi:hypothetical protein
MILYFDIETLPCNDPGIIAEIGKTITAPANYSKPESIVKWMEENFAAALTEKVAKTSFDGLLGSIACICYAFDDGPVFEVSVHGHTEREMLEHFYSHVYDVASVEHHAGLSPIDLTVCGHNVAGFDLPFIKHRSVINGVRPPVQMFKAMNAKAWDFCIADTMLMWSADREKRASMDKLCRAFGIPGKGDFDGSMVAATWPTDPQKVIDYCKADVERTRQIYKRLTFQLEAA